MSPNTASIEDIEYVLRDEAIDEEVIRRSIRRITTVNEPTCADGVQLEFPFEQCTNHYQ